MDATICATTISNHVAPRGLGQGEMPRSIAMPPLTGLNVGGRRPCVGAVPIMQA